MSQAGLINSKGGGGGGNVQTLTGNTGGAVGPTANNINVIGNNTQGINIDGNPGTSTLTVSGINASSTQLGVASFNAIEFNVTAGAVASNPITLTAGIGITITGSPVNLGGTVTISASGVMATTFTEDSGTATPAANNLNIFGTAAQGISTSGAGSSVTLTIANASSIQKGVASFNPTNFTSTAGVITSNPITVIGAGGITISGSPVNLGGSLTVTAGGTIPTTFTEDSGTATPSGNNLNILGGTGVKTSGSGSTVTINVVGGGFKWIDEAVSFNALVNTGYFVTAIATATLPAAPAQGDTIVFSVDTASILTITANAGQVIRIGAAVSAAAGTAANNARGDSVTLVYRASDTTWIASAVIGTWTVT